MPWETISQPNRKSQGGWETIKEPSKQVIQPEPQEDDPRSYFDRFIGYVKKNSVQTAQGNFVFQNRGQARPESYEDLTTPAKAAGALATPVYAARDVGKVLFESTIDYTKDLGDVMSRGKIAENTADMVSQNSQKIVSLQKELKNPTRSKEKIKNEIELFQNRNKELAEEIEKQQDFDTKRLVLNSIGSGIELGTLGLESLLIGQLKKQTGKQVSKGLLKKVASDRAAIGTMAGVESMIRGEKEGGERSRLKDFGTGFAFGYGITAGAEKLGKFFKGRKAAKALKEVDEEAARGAVRATDLGDIFEGKKTVDIRKGERPSELGMKKLAVTETKPAQKVDIDKVIKESDFVDYTVRKEPAIKTVEGKKAAGRARFDFKEGKGIIEVSSKATDTTKAHEFAHVVNYKMGTGQEKLSTELNQFIQGKKTDPPEFIEKYATKIGEDPKTLAKEIAQEIRKASRADLKGAMKSLDNPSEEFSHAFANVLTKTETAQNAPKWARLVEDEIIKAKRVKTPQKAKMADTAGKKAIQTAKKTRAEQREAALAYVRSKKSAKFRGAEAPKVEALKGTHKRAMKALDIARKKGNKVVIKRMEKQVSLLEKKIVEERTGKKGWLFREKNLKTDFKKATGVSLSKSQERKINKLNKKIFGDDKVKVVAQVVANKKALGAYKDGMIQIVKGKADAADTFYHEAVHKYLDVFTSEGEQAELLLAAQRKYGGDNFAEIEEKLAEDFIKYAKGREGVSGVMKRVFDKVLGNIKKYIKSEDEIEKLYSDIFAGKAKKATQKKSVIIDPDALKKKAFKSGDKTAYDPKRHEEFSAAAKKRFAKELQTNTNPVVKFTAGGSGSGKSELILKGITDDFDGVVVDGTLANYDSAIKKFQQVADAGKDVEIYAVMPRIEKAWEFAEKRRIKTGRGVPVEVFVKKHTGFVKTVKRLVKEGYPVFLKDTREVYHKTEAKYMPYETNRKEILDKLEKISYVESEVISKLQKYEVSKKAKRKIVGQLESERRRIQQAGEGVEQKGKRQQIAGKAKRRLDEAVGADQGLAKQIKRIKEKPSSLGEGGFVVKPEIIKETKKTVRVKTPSKITEGGMILEGNKKIKTPSINLSKLNTSDDVKTMIDKFSAADKKAIDYQRRGKISNKELDELASMTGLKPDDILKAEAGSIVNAENAVAARRMMATMAEDITETVKNFPVSPTKEQLKDFKLKMDRFRGVQKAIAGFRSEAGRLLQSYRKEVMAEEYDIYDDMIKAVSKIDQDEADSIGKAAKLGEVVKPDSLYQLAIKGGMEARTAFLLYNPTTHVANIIGNSVNAVKQPVQKFLASKIGKGVAKGEASAQVRGMKDALPEAMTQLRDDFKNIIKNKEVTGFTDKTDEVARAHKMYELMKRSGVSESTATKLDSIIRTSFKMLTAGDNFFRTINSAGELYSNALRRATAEGLSGAKLDKRVREMIEDPMKFDDLAETVNRNVDTLLFQEDIPSWVNKVSLAGEGTPAAIFKILITPFRKTPYNIMREAVRTSPLGFMRPVVAKLQGKELQEAERAMAYAQATIGTALSAVAAYGILEGNVTASAPLNPKERDEFYASGKQPYSIKVGDTWYSYRRVEPLANAVALTANAVQTMKSEKDVEKKMLEAGMQFAQSFTDQTFMKGANDFFNAVLDPERYGKRFVQNIGTSFIPFGTGISAVARASDPKMRQTETFKEKVQAMIPSESQKLPSKVDIFGREVEREGTFGGKLLMPFKKATDKQDRTIEELEKSGYNLTTYRLDEIRGVKLKGKAKEEWLKIVGKATKRELDKAVSSPRFQRMSQLEKDERLKEVVTKVRAKYRKKATVGMQTSLKKRKKVENKEAFDDELRGRLNEKIFKMKQ